LLSGRGRKERSYFSSILGLFLVLSVCIIFIATGVYFSRTQRLIHDAFSVRNLKSVSQVSHMFDVLHSQLIPGLKEASYNNYTFSRLMYDDNVTEYEMLKGLDALDDLLLSYPLINSLYIYNGQMNVFLSTSRGLEPADEFFDREVLKVVRKFDHNLIDRYWPRTVEKKTPFSQITETGPVLTLLMGTTPEHEAPLKGALISNIDVKELQNLLNTRYDAPDDEIIIVNHQGELICRSRDDSTEDYRNLFDRVRATEQERGNLPGVENRLVSYQMNHRLGWYFIAVMPLEKINREIMDASRSILLIMSGVLILSALLSYFAARRIYRPIDSLMHVMAEGHAPEGGLPAVSDSRELSFIMNRYRDILTEKVTLEDSLEDLQDDYRLEIFRSILEGHEYHFWEEELQEGDMDLMHNPLSLFLIQIDNYYRISRSMEPAAFRILRKNLVDLIKESLQECSPVLVDMDVRNLVCLFPGKPEDVTGDMRALQERIRTDQPVSVSMACTGRRNCEEARLHTLYSRALAAVGNKFSRGFNSFIPYSNQDESTIIFPGELADRMLQHMRQGDLSGALNKLEELGLILKKGTCQDFLQHTRILSYRLLRFLKEKNLPEVKKLLQQVRTYPETLETLQNFREFFRDILESIQKQSEQPGRKGMGHFRLIEEQLKGNYRDPACCVQSLADSLDFSPNYLRQIYKNYSGNSLSDEIVRMRVEEACRLLEETGDPVKELYSEAGFTNYNSFFTCFKRIKGETPAEYRRTRKSS